MVDLGPYATVVAVVVVVVVVVVVMVVVVRVVVVVVMVLVVRVVVLVGVLAGWPVLTYPSPRESPDVPLYARRWRPVNDHRGTRQ